MTTMDSIEKSIAALGPAEFRSWTASEQLRVLPNSHPAVVVGRLDFGPMPSGRAYTAEWASPVEELDMGDSELLEAIREFRNEALANLQERVYLDVTEKN